MDALTITDLEPPTVNSFRRVAEANCCSVEEEAAMLIRSGLAHVPTLSRRERADAIAAMTPANVTQADSVALIREMRGERDRDLGR